MGIPIKIIYFMCRFGMGELGTVYKRAIRTPIKIDEILAGQVPRWVTDQPGWTGVYYHGS